MNLRKLVLGLIILHVTASLFIGALRDQSFDSSWRWLRADSPAAEYPALMVQAIF